MLLLTFNLGLIKNCLKNEEIAFCAQDTTFQLHSDDSGSPVNVQAQAKQAKSWLKHAESFCQK